MSVSDCWRTGSKITNKPAQPTQKSKQKMCKTRGDAQNVLLQAAVKKDWVLRGSIMNTVYHGAAKKT